MTLLLDKLTVYGEMLPVVVALLSPGDYVRAAEIRARLLPAASGSDSERELLAYLAELGLVRLGDNGQVSLGTETVPVDLRLAILERLSRAHDENAVILDVYRFLLGEETFAGRVLERDQIWPLYNRQRLATADHEVMLNSPKMASWLRLMSYLGLVRPERSNSFVLAPSLHLARELLAAGAGGVSGDALNLARLIVTIEERFCPVTCRPGRLHPGFADALELLELLEEVELSVLGDAEAALVNGRRVSQLALRLRLPAQEH
jgi:hypothetical protein